MREVILWDSFLCTDRGLLHVFLLSKHSYIVHQHLIQNSSFVTLCCVYCKVLDRIHAVTQQAEKCRELGSGVGLNSSRFPVHFILHITTSRPDAYTDNLFCKLSSLLHLSHVENHLECNM